MRSSRAWSSGRRPSSTSIAESIEELKETKKYAYTFKKWAQGTDVPRPRFAAGDAGGDAAGDPTEDPEELAHFLADCGDGLCGYELCDDDFDSMAAGGLAVGEGA